MGTPALRDQFPLHLVIGGHDCSFLLDDGFSFSNVDPGGFEACSFAIPKDMPQSIRGQPIILHSGLQTAWEGRISEVQRSLGNRTTITGEGYGGRFRDEAIAQIFIDRDLTQWQGPSVTEQIAQVSGGWAPQGPQVAADPVSGSPSVASLFTGPWGSGGLPMVRAMYDSRGIPLGALYANWDIPSTNATLGFTDWVWQAYLSVDDVLSTIDNTSNLAGAGPTGSTGTLYAGAANRVYAFLDAYFSAAGGADNNIYGVYWSDVAVYGRHGLTPVGGVPNGFYPSQIVSWLLSQVPGVQAGTIQTTDSAAYVVPHSAYYDAVNGDTILNDMAQFAAWHWGVWESPTPLTGSQLPRLDFLPRPADGTWQAWAWRSQLETCDLREDLSGLYDGAIVQYTTVDGLDRSVLVTIDNPYLDLTGIGRGVGGPGRTVVLNAGTVGGGSGPSQVAMTVAAAQAYGLACLRLLMVNARVAGTLVIEQAIQSASGGSMAPWMLRAGETRIRVPDLPSTDYAGAHNDLPITRVSSSISSEAFSTTVEIGQGGNLLETFQARATAAAQTIGQ